MSQTDLAMLALLFGALLFAGVRHLVELGPEPITLDLRPKRLYEAPFRQPGPPLKKRPEGKQALKAEIALTPPGYVPAPPVVLHTRRSHVDWLNTQEIELRWQEHFADQPDGLAVQREWMGAGR